MLQEKSMFFVNDEDGGHAVFDLVKCPFQTVGNLKWEIELKNGSEKFWKFFITPIEEHSLQAGYMRTMLTYVFATIYYACGETLPHLHYEKARTLTDSSMETDKISKGVFHRMEEIKADWASTFRKINEEFYLYDDLRRTMFVAIKILLDSPLKRRPNDEDGEEEIGEERGFQLSPALI